jgi:hypothetical protein
MCAGHLDMKHAVGGIAILVDALAAALKRVEAAD